jgi:hypothetical protein
MKVTDMRVQTLGDGSYAHLAFQHRVGVVEHGDYRVAGVSVVVACH